MNKYMLVLVGTVISSIFYMPAYAAQQVSKYGMKVEICSFDYKDEDFCAEKRLKSYAKVLKTRKPNFDHDKIIYIFEAVDKGNLKNLYNMVVINKNTKSVSPFFYSLSDARNSYGYYQVINAKGDTIEFDFNVNSDRFCFKGNIDAYRDSYGYEQGPFCFKYSDKYDGLIRED